MSEANIASMIQQNHHWVEDLWKRSLDRCDTIAPERLTLEICMAFFTKPLRLGDLEPYLRLPEMYAKITLGRRDERPYLYCGVANEISFSLAAGKKTLITSVTINMAWFVEIRRTTNVTGTDDIHLDRAIPNTLGRNYPFPILKPCREFKDGILTIYNLRDQIEIATGGMLAVLVLRAQSEYPQVEK